MSDVNQYPKKKISGGQTGADQAALAVAIKLGIAHGDLRPKGRITEARFLLAKYQLQEMPTANYPLRIEKNVIDSDATLITSHGKLAEGSELTEKYAEKHKRLCLQIDFDKMPHLEAALKIATWILKNNVGVLNVAGPRASKGAKIYQAVSDVLESVIHLCSVKNIPPRYNKHDSDSDADIINEILIEMPLWEKSAIANLGRDQVETLQSVFDNIRSKIIPDDPEDDFRDIMFEIWEVLRETKSIRSIK